MRAMKQKRVRKGAVAVEFAIVAPVLLAIMFGMIQYGKAFEMQNQLQVAAREGARFASMDHTGMLAAGQTSNQKLIQEVKNFLATYGIAQNDVTVTREGSRQPDGRLQPGRSGKRSQAVRRESIGELLEGEPDTGVGQATTTR